MLDGVDLRAERGSVFSLLGPNGAGKTTMVRILSTLLRADAGRARVAGHDVVADRRAVRRSISLTGQYAAVDELQTGEENLRMMGALSGLGRARARARARELLARVRPRRRRPAPGRHVLRRHAPAPRPRREPGRAAVGDLPRRADHRPGPAQPPGDVGRDRRARRLRGRRSSSRRSTSRRPTASPTASPSSTAGAWSPRARRPSSSSGRGDQRLDLVLADADAFDDGRARARRPRDRERRERAAPRRARPTAARRTCARCSTRSTPTAAPSSGSPSTARRSTTSSSPSPATAPPDPNWRPPMSDTSALTLGRALHAAVVAQHRRAADRAAAADHADAALRLPLRRSDRDRHRVRHLRRPRRASCCVPGSARPRPR